MHKDPFRLAFAVLFFVAAFHVGSAERPPRPTRQPAVVSPEINTDRSITFRLQAPKATEVTVGGQWANGRTNLNLGSNGVWSITVGPLEPGVYEYGFVVDGLSMIDPGNPAIKPMRQPRTSILHLPGQPPLVHDFQPVAHGVPRQHTYASKSLGRPRDLVVYTPPGYDQQFEARFPTLYLLHGSGDNQATWTVHGKAHWILDNLLAQGRIRPMIVVMMDGHAHGAGAGSGGFTNNSVAFERDLVDDVLPWVEANYRVRNDAGQRAIVGLSMGGEQALRIGLNHLDLFAWVGGFSAGAPSQEAIQTVLADSSTANARLKLLWVGCGKEDFLLQRNEEFVALLKQKEIRHEWHLTDGGHSWPVWRLYLAELAPKLFQP